MTHRAAPGTEAEPDLVVGIAVALIAAKGGIEILADARRTRHGAVGGAGS